MVIFILTLSLMLWQRFGSSLEQFTLDVMILAFKATLEDVNFKCFIILGSYLWKLIDWQMNTGAQFFLFFAICSWITYNGILINVLFVICLFKEMDSYRESIRTATVYQRGFDIGGRTESSPDFWIQQIRGKKGLHLIQLWIMFLMFYTQFLSPLNSWRSFG